MNHGTEMSMAASNPHAGNALAGNALRRLLHPESVALIGATVRPGAFGDRVLTNMHAYEGRLYLMNARYERIGERPCFANLTDLPEVPDCAVIAVGREAVEPVLLDCAARGVGGAIVFASGYAETAKPDRAEQQQRLTAIARATGLRIVGPNCIGLVNYLCGAGMTFSAMPDQTETPQRAIGVISQSGALGFAMSLAIIRGVPISHVLTSGNSCDVSMADYIDYLVAEPSCAAIACLFEGIADPTGILAAARRAQAAGKPLVVCKLATSESGARASLSHTGSLAGSHVAYRAALSDAGAILVERFEALIETAAFFAKAPKPTASGIAVVATSGGAGIMAADHAERHGVDLPQPGDAARAVLESHIPEYGSARNPCDVTAQVLTDPESLNACARALFDDPAFTALVVPSVYAYAPAAKRIPVLGAAASAAGKLVCNVWVNEWLEGPGALEAERDPNTVLFRSMDRCFATLAAWFARAETAPDPQPHLRLTSEANRAEVGRMLAGHQPGQVIGEQAAKTMLASYGVPVVSERLVQNAADAVAAAEAFGLQVALKVASADLPHKTEAGVIRLNVVGAAAVREAYAAILANATKAGARVEGVLVQPMVPAGTEMVVGARIDPQFGPLITVGFGGILVEVLQDSATALAPISPAKAMTMLRRLKGQRLFAGFRGAPAVDLTALAELVSRVSEFAADHAAMISELDINPLICTGTTFLAVDALIVRTPPS
jgi:acetyl-CoA synthetase